MLIRAAACRFPGCGCGCGRLASLKKTAGHYQVQFTRADAWLIRLRLQVSQGIQARKS
jgi:hypothetical protein